MITNDTKYNNIHVISKLNLPN